MGTKVYKRGNYALTITTMENGTVIDRYIDAIEQKPFYPDMRIFGSNISIAMTGRHLFTAEDIDLALAALKEAKKAKAYFDGIMRGEN
jgi:hypothetical protein